MIEKSITDALNTGIIIGLNQSLNALNLFLDRKYADREPDYITKQELNIFLKELITKKEKSFGELNLH